VLAHLPVGARTETKANNGISHFLEHMLFTGNAAWNESELADEVRRRGGQYNGQTSREETIYYIHLDTEHLDFALDWMYQLLVTPTLSAKKFEKERQVIINEKGGEFDRLQRAWEWVEDRNLGWSVMRAVRRRLYPNSPMLLPVIGRDKTLKSITHQDLVNFYKTYYVPRNITLIVVGDIDPEGVFEIVESQFRGIEDRPSPPSLPPVRAVNHPFNVALHGPMPNDQGQLLVGAMLGPGGHEDRFGWWVIEEMLDNAYMQDIRYQRGLTYSVNVFTTLYTDSGYFGVYARAKQHDMAYIRQAIDKHLNRIMNGDFTEAELDEAKTAIRGRTLLDLQDNLELANWLTFDALHTTDDLTPMDDYFEHIASITPDDVQQIAARYLRPELRFRVEHQPLVTPRQLRPFAVGLLGATTALWSLRKVASSHRR
jgi:predicted Zn-dependent peptidase